MQLPSDIWCSFHQRDPYCIISAVPVVPAQQRLHRAAKMSKKVRERGHKEKGNSHRGGVRGWADIMHEVAEAVPPPDESEAHAVQQPSVRLTLWDFGQVNRRACA